MADLTLFAELPIWLAHTADKKPCSYIDGTAFGNLQPERWGTQAQVDDAIRQYARLVGRTIVCGVDLNDPSGMRLAAIDTDHCYSADEPNVMADWAHPVHALLNGHLTERSKSGLGVHHFFLVDPDELPEGCVSADFKQGPVSNSYGFELFISKPKPVALNTTQMQGNLQVLPAETLAAVLAALAAFAPPKAKAGSTEVPLEHPRRSRRFDQDHDYALAFEIIERLRNDYDWSGWHTLGGGFYNTTTGSEEAYRTFERFTERGGYASAKDLRACRTLWNGFRSNRPVPDMGHLVNEAKKQGVYDDAMEAVFGPRRKNGHADEDFHDYSDYEPEHGDAVEIEDVGRMVATPKRPRFDLKSNYADRWDGKVVPVLKFLVNELLPYGMCALVGGDSGAGKSILMQTLATCIAATDLAGYGHPFLGRQTMGGVAVYITGEDPEDVLHMRQDRILRALDLPWSAVKGRLIVRSMVEHDIWLYQQGRVTHIAKELTEELAGLEDLRTCIIDSAALVFDDDEIRRAPVAGFMKFMNRTAMELQATIPIIAHTSRSSRGDTKSMVSGSTGWVAHSRAGILLETNDADSAVKLSLVKPNYAKRGITEDLIWNPDGVLLRKPPTGQVERIELANDEKRIMEEVRRAWFAKSPLSLHVQSKGRYLPRIMSEKHGMKAGHADKLTQTMMHRGDLVLRVANKNSKLTGLCPKDLDPDPPAPITEA